MEATRFLAVAVAGLIVDLAVAWSAAHFLDMPLWLAAVAGFAVAATFNYALHELWTFRAGARRLSAGRALRYAVALAATLSARVATVALLDAKLAGTVALPVLVAGAGVSFCVNYFISKHFVFRHGTELEESAP
jgi:putative flippase GtrA